VTGPKLDMTQAVSRVQELRTQLNVATDKLTGTLIEAENALASLQLNASAGVPLPYDRPNWTRTLIFAKEGSPQRKIRSAGLWRLMVEQGPINGIPDVKLLVGCSREIRVRASEMLPALLNALITAAEAQVARVVESSQVVTSFISTVKRQRPLRSLKDFEGDTAINQQLADSMLEELRQEDDAAALRTFQSLPSVTDYDSAVSFFINNPGKLAKGADLSRPNDITSIRVLASIKDAADFFRTVIK